MIQDDVLGGFSAVFEAMNKQNEPDNLSGDNAASVEQDDTNSILNNLFKPSDDDQDDVADMDAEVQDDEPADVNPEGDSQADNQGQVDIDPADSNDDGLGQVVSTFFDAIAEAAGWSDITDEERPKTVEGLVDYMKSVVEASSTPEYASEEIAAMDEYVRNGGRIEDYVSQLGSQVDYSNIDLTDEHTQRSVVREFLLEKGFSEQQIKRKLEKYEDADILEDEAIDAVEGLKEIKQERKKELLEEQKKAQQTMIQEQQKFYNNVVQEVEALTDIRGIQIPKTDKQALMDYIFKVEADGRTKYQKDYASSTKNLIESAYFTMKGDALLSSAKKSGETSAVEKLRNTLNSTKVSGSKQRIDNRSARPLWSVVSTQLQRRPQ